MSKKHQSLLALVILALSMLGYSSYSVYMAGVSRSWPVTSGQVTRSELVSRWSRSRRVHHPYIRFEYYVHGERYGSNNIRYGEPANGGSGLNLNFLRFLGDDQATLRKYPTGKTVAVRYNPTDPSQAVVETELPQSIWFAFLLSTALTVGGFGVAALVR